MAYTVKRLATLSGVSNRTLHHYDEIGLLKPSYYGANGYRYYEHEQLLVLQQILFLRELGLSLFEIKTIIAEPNFNKIEALRSHKKRLKKDLNRIIRLMKTIDKTIHYLRGKCTMHDNDLYKGFNDIQRKEMEKYFNKHMGQRGEEILSTSKEKLASMSEDEIKKLYQETDDLSQKFLILIKNRKLPESKEAQALVMRHYTRACRFANISKEEFLQINKIDVVHPESRKRFDAVHPKFADFFIKAITIFVKGKK